MSEALKRAGLEVEIWDSVAYGWYLKPRKSVKKQKRGFPEEVVTELNADIWPGVTLKKNLGVWAGVGEEEFQGL